MNKFSELSKEEMLDVCQIINPDTKWKFFQLLNNDGKGTDDCYEFIADDLSILQFNVHQNKEQELRFYYKVDIDGDIFYTGLQILKKSEDKINFYLTSFIKNGKNL